MACRRRSCAAARDFELVSGDWADFEQHQDSAVVGRAVASRRGLKAGDKFSIGDLTVQVAGVFTSDDPAEENYIYSHLEFLQRGKAADLVGTVTQHEVLLAAGRRRGGEVGGDRRAVSRRARSRPTRGPRACFRRRAWATLTQLIGLAHYLGYACVGLVLALVATTTVMCVQDRIKEHAVLQTLGFTGSRVFRLVLVESTLLSIAGGMLGVGAAMLVLAMESSVGRGRSGDDRVSAVVDAGGDGDCRGGRRGNSGGAGAGLARGADGDRGGAANLIGRPN